MYSIPAIPIESEMAAKYNFKYIHVVQIMLS